MLFAVAGCRLWTLPVLDRPRRSARVSGPDPHTLRSAVGFQSVGIAPRLAGHDYPPLLQWPAAADARRRRGLDQAQVTLDFDEPSQDPHRGHLRSRGRTMSTRCAADPTT